MSQSCPNLALNPVADYSTFANFQTDRNACASGLQGFFGCRFAPFDAFGLAQSSEAEMSGVAAHSLAVDGAEVFSVFESVCLGQHGVGRSILASEQECSARLRGGGDLCCGGL